MTQRKTCPYCFEIIPEERTCKCLSFPEKMKITYDLSIGDSYTSVGVYSYKTPPKKSYRFKIGVIKTRECVLTEIKNLGRYSFYFCLFDGLEKEGQPAKYGLSFYFRLPIYRGR